MVIKNSYTPEYTYAKTREEYYRDQEKKSGRRKITKHSGLLGVIRKGPSK